MVNIYNLLDHRRNSEVPVRPFRSYRVFSEYIRNGKTFPREAANQDGFISAS